MIRAIRLKLNNAIFTNELDFGKSVCFHKRFKHNTELPFLDGG